MAIDSLSQGVNDPYTEYQSRLGLETLLTIFRSLRRIDPFLQSLVATCQNGLKRTMIEHPDMNSTVSFHTWRTGRQTDDILAIGQDQCYTELNNVTTSPAHEQRKFCDARVGYP